MVKIQDRLPDKGYQDNQSVEWVLSHANHKISQWATLMETFHLQLSPVTCSDDKLDWLSQLYGFTGKYWNFQWSITQKRNILRLGLSFWRRKGTRSSIEQWVSALGLPIQVWTGDRLVLPFAMPATLTSPKFKIILRIPFSEVRGNQIWRESHRITEILTPITTPTYIGFDAFRVGYSQLGEPMFEQPLPELLTTENRDNLLVDNSDRNLTTS